MSTSKSAFTSAFMGGFNSGFNSSFNFSSGLSTENNSVYNRSRAVAETARRIKENEAADKAAEDAYAEQMEEQGCCTPETVCKIITAPIWAPIVAALLAIVILIGTIYIGCCAFYAYTCGTPTDQKKIDDVAKKFFTGRWSELQ